MLKTSGSKNFYSSLPSPNEIKKQITIQQETRFFIENSRSEISAILNGQDSRLLLVVGPCSIHSIDEAKEYAKKIQSLQQKVKDHFFILMRVYFAKSRTALGWKGFLFDPDLNHTCDVKKGITQTRELLAFLAEHEVPVATEFLDPLSVHYFEDLISWGCIGARTSESQTHRELASGLNMPVGFKNNTNGSIKIAVNGVCTSRESHTFLGIDDEGFIAKITTKGNPNCHIVMRGGDSGTNYDPESIAKALELLKKHSLVDKVMIDCSHGNSKSNHNNQIIVFESLINQIIEGNTNISGLILESYHHEGKQNLESYFTNSPLKYGISITDPCINWETTEKLILWGYKKLQKNALLHLSSCNQ